MSALGMSCQATRVVSSFGMMGEMCRSRPTRRISSMLAAAILVACSQSASNADVQSAAPASPPAYFELGRPIDSARLAKLDIDVDTSGVGLPPGSGTPAQGLLVFAETCATCHGAHGEGIGPAPKLVGRDPRTGFPFGRDPKLVKTVGNYWPYPTTLYDYIHRAMPLSAPGSLTPNQVYGVVAWLLAENEIIPRAAVIDARSLPAVKMPARSHFVLDDRQGKTVR
jgi:S-disulfanyl-L-cysteine oxidoreductase SoxD